MTARSLAAHGTGRNARNRIVQSLAFAADFQMGRRSVAQDRAVYGIDGKCCGIVKMAVA